MWYIALGTVPMYLLLQKFKHQQLKKIMEKESPNLMKTPTKAGIVVVPVYLLVISHHLGVGVASAHFSAS